MDHYAADVAAVVEALDLNNAIHVGHSTGGGEVAAYLGRYGTKRAAKAVLLDAVTPVMVKSASNPGGLPIEVFDGLRAALAANRFAVLSRRGIGAVSSGFNRPGRDGDPGRDLELVAPGHDGSARRRITTASRPFPKRTSRKT